MVVATVGAELKDGDKVKRAPVGGVMSEGMLCDGPMLGWAGGGAGTAVPLRIPSSPETHSTIAPSIGRRRRR